uniref:Serine-threonine/tyrosine-protein kinase catalytic domain-containing protein n=1 Tax=Arundo donax TaxID=35708 RepID=A0A0A9BLZ0_ARUDO
MRLEIPSWVHPGLSKLIQQCWDANPHLRPSFSEITIELEDILRHVQVTSKGAHRHSKAKLQEKSQR